MMAFTDMTTNSDGLQIYPNPTSGRCRIFYTEKEKMQSVTVEILNLTGNRVCLTGSSSITGSEIDLAGQPAGIYFIRVGTSAGVLTGKLVLIK